jgi:hypothetical protein
MNPDHFSGNPWDWPAAKRGNCYVTSEALFHLLGGKAAGWTPMSVRTDTDVHWFLKHSSGMILDATAAQFGGHLPDYTQARGRGFLTRRPSKRAAALMERMLWQTSRS